MKEKDGGGGGNDGKFKEKDGGGGGGGSGGGGSKNKSGGGQGGGREVFFLSFNLFNIFLMTKSTPGSPGAFFTRSIPGRFLLLRFLSNDPTIGFSASKVDTSSKQAQLDFVCLKYFFLLDLIFV